MTGDNLICSHRIGLPPSRLPTHNHHTSRPTSRVATWTRGGLYSVALRTSAPISPVGSRRLSTDSPHRIRRANGRPYAGTIPTPSCCPGCTPDGRFLLRYQVVGKPRDLPLRGTRSGLRRCPEGAFRCLPLAGRHQRPCEVLHMKKKYTPHADIHRDSVVPWERRGNIFFLMKDEHSVRGAVKRRATRLEDTDYVPGI